MKLKIQISIGELIDKLSILEIKKEKISDSEKIHEIKKEYSYLKKVCEQNINEYENFVDKIKKINTKLWGIENKLRELEKKKKFDSEFIKLARSVYSLNDNRFKIKNQINLKFNSNIMEQKSYE